MSLNAAALKIMAEKGLTATDIAEIAAANEKKADPTAAQRQARCRARKAQSLRDVTRDPPNDNSSNPPDVSPKPDGLAPVQKSKRAKGNRLPADWELPVEWRQWAKGRKGWTDGEISEEAEIFANYWQAKSGAGACHTNWLKTWQNWCIRSHRPNGKADVPESILTAEQWEKRAEFYEGIGQNENAEICREKARAAA